MKITIIDFETANTNRASACSIGIHGITHEDVRDAPGFDTVFQELRPHFENTLLAAHNAVFDMGVLDALLRHYGIPFSCDYFCTLAVSRSVWPDLLAHNLRAMADHLGVELDHHRAGSDAYAAARIILALLAEKRMERLQMIVSQTKRFARDKGDTSRPDSIRVDSSPVVDSYRSFKQGTES